MSLLGNNVFANPTTPLWGGGGGGGGSNPTYTSVSFTLAAGEPSPGASTKFETAKVDDVGSTICALDADGDLGPLAATALYTRTAFPRTIYQDRGIDFQDAGATSYFLAEVNSGSNGWDLQNISTINGSAYPPSGSGSNFQTLNITQTGGNAGELNFYKDVSGTSFTQVQMYPNPASVLGSQVLSVFDASGLADTLQVGDLQAAGTGSLPDGEPPALSLGTAGTGTLGLRLVNTDVGGVTSTYATFASNAFDLSNVTSINGVPYFNSPGTQFDYRNYPGGSPLVEAPDWGVLNAISFTPPVNGKVYVESLGTYVALVSGGGVAMTFAVDGTNVSEAPTVINAYAGNTNLFGTSMLQFAVSANVTYDISSIAHCSAIPPSDPDVVVTSSRMFLLFSPN